MFTVKASSAFFRIYRYIEITGTYARTANGNRF